MMKIDQNSLKNISTETTTEETKDHIYHTCTLLSLYCDEKTSFFGLQQTLCLERQVSLHNHGLKLKFCLKLL